MKTSTDRIQSLECASGRRRAFLACAWRGGIAALGSTAVAEVSNAGGVGDELRKLVGQESTLRIALIDVSASPAQSDPKGLYRDAARAFFDGAATGDDLIIAPIGDRGMDGFVAETVALPRTGRKFDDRKGRQEAQEKANQIVDRLISGPLAPSSRIIETLASLQPAASSAVAAGKAVRVLMATDGIEHSRLGQFDDLKFTDGRADALLNRLIQSNLLMWKSKGSGGTKPDLVTFIVGGGGGSAEVWQRNKRFWEKYHDACGVQLAFYGRSLPRFA